MVYHIDAEALSRQTAEAVLIPIEDEEGWTDTEKQNNIMENVICDLMIQILPKKTWNM